MSISQLGRATRAFKSVLRDRLFLNLPEAYRDKAASELDDRSLVAWVRWALANCAKFYEKDAAKRGREISEVVTQHGVIALALLTLEANATTGTFTVNGVKGLITMRHDTVVLPYAKSAVTLPRRCIMLATVNPESGGYLTDSTGNRRYWPVEATKIDLDGILAKRDQLWAEAMHRYRAGERWWLDGDENKSATVEQEDRGQQDPWVEPLRKKLDERAADSGTAISHMTADEALTLLGVPHERKDKRAEMRVTAALSDLDFVRKKVRPESGPGQSKGKPRWMWVRE